MEDIDYYIEKAANMENTSDGGSDAYHFSDVVLVKYSMSKKYGSARECEEFVAQKANERNAKGVRTPKHLSIKRVIEGENDICWVLQERARGKSFSEYVFNENSQVQLEKQSQLVNAPDTHYEKLVSDVCELFDLGLELKSKNMYYDESIQDGGFTIIDLLKGSGQPFDTNSLRDTLFVYRMLGTVYNNTQIPTYDKKASENEKDISKQLHFKIIQKLFSAMEKTIPNFDQQRRWFLRSLRNEVLESFVQNGIHVGDLTLNEQEYEKFNQTIRNIVDNSIQKIENGTHKYWEIVVNEINIDLERWGLQDAWKYHKENNRSKDEFSDSDYPEYDYNRVCTDDLEKAVYQMFNEKLDVYSNGSTNPQILKAKEDLDMMRAKQEEEKKQL